MRRGVRDARARRQYVFGKREHDRSHPPAHRRLERTCDVLGNAIDSIDLRDPFRHRPEHAAVVDLLERFAIDEIGAHLTDENDHRHRVLECRVHADRGVGRAGTARDHHHAGSAGELCVCVGHVGRAAFLPADDEAQAIAMRMQAVEDGEVAFAGNAEHSVDALADQRVGDDVPADALAHGCGPLAHGCDTLAHGCGPLAGGCHALAGGCDTLARRYDALARRRCSAQLVPPRSTIVGRPVEPSPAPDRR